jgi:cell division septation protein DedD
VKLQLFAVRPFTITFFVALSIVSTALGESSVPERHDGKASTTERSSSDSAPRAELPRPAASAQAVTDPPARIAAVLALREELDKLADNALIDLLREGPRPNLDRSRLEDNLKRVAAFDPDTQKDALLRTRLLEAFVKAVDANTDQKPEDLLSLAISDVLKARRRVAPQASPSATATTTVTATAPGAGIPFGTPTPQPTLTPTVFDPLKASQDLLKGIEAQRKQEDDLAKNLRDALGQGAGGLGAGGGGEGSGSGGDSGGGAGSGGEGAGSPGDSASKSSDSPSKNRSSDSPLAKNASKANPPPADVSPASSSETKKEDQKPEPLDLGLKKTPPPAEPKPKANPVAMPTPLVPDVKNPSVPVVAKRPANDFGPSEPLNQPIAAAQSELPATDGAGSVGGVGGFGGGAAGAGAVGGGGGSLGGDGVLNVGNFPPPAGGGGGPFTYIKTGPGDWLQAGGGGGEAAFTAFGGGAADYEEPTAPKTATPTEQILRVGALEPVGGAAGVRGARGVAGIGAAAGSARGVFSLRPTMTALCALGRMALCENPKRFATRPSGRGIGR